jgi:hypothetical protein
LQKLDFLATPRTEVDLARKLGAEATAFWENADTDRSALTPIKKYSEGTLKLLATNSNFLLSWLASSACLSRSRTNA